MSNKEIKMNNDPEWLIKQVRAEEELYAQGWNGCTSVGGSFITRKENISRFAKKLASDLKKIEEFSAEINKPIPRMDDTAWVTPMTNWLNEDANITEASDVKQWEQEIPTYSPEVHAVLGQMMNDTIVNMRQEQAYKIWVSEDKPDGEQEELCPFCGKLFKIKDRHYWEAFFALMYKNDPCWKANYPARKMVCDAFHEEVETKMVDEINEAVRNRRQEEYLKRTVLMPDPIEQLEITDYDYYVPEYDGLYCPRCYRMLSDDVYLVSDKVEHFGCNKCLPNI